MIEVSQKVQVLLRQGKFAAVQEYYPDKILFADDEERVMVLNGEAGIEAPRMSMSVSYAANYVFIRNSNDHSRFHVAKNRMATHGAAASAFCKVLELDTSDIALDLNPDRLSTELIVRGKSESAAILRLKGVL